MLRSLFLSILLCSIGLHISAQNTWIQVNKVHSDNYCLGSELVMEVATVGTFSPDNKFYVVVYMDSNNPAQKWQYPAELSGNKLTTVLKDEAIGNLPYFYLKVITTSPATEASVSGTHNAQIKSTLHLMTRYGRAEDQLNSTDPPELVLTSTPASPGKATLNTGETINLTARGNPSLSPTTLFSPAKTIEGIYSIKEASNACGAFNVTGQVQIKLNPIDFIPVNISPSNVCEGNTFKVVFQTGGASFPTNTRFKVRFYVGMNGQVGSQKYIDVPVTLSGTNELTGVIPGGFTSAEVNIGVYVGIVTENPNGEARNQRLKVNILPKPSVTLKATKNIIDLGEEVYISSNPEGLGPYKVTLQSGEVFDHHLTLKPFQTTTYTVKKFESACGTIENPAFPQVTVFVSPSLLLNPDEPISNTPSACEGTKVRMKFRAVGTNSGTTYSIEASNYANMKFTFAARVIGDSVEFEIPKTIVQDPKNDLSKITNLKLVSTNPSLTSPATSFRIFSPPFITMSEYSQTSVKSPSNLAVFIQLNGGAPYTLENKDGTKETISEDTRRYDLFIRKDTTFQLGSLSNQCFRSTNLTSFPLKVENPESLEPSLFIELLKTDYCMGDSVLVKADFNGQFMPGNQFNISFDGLGSSETPLISNITKPGIYKVKIPERQFPITDVTIKLVSTQPRLVSQTDRPRIAIKPGKYSINEHATKQNPYKLYLKDSIQTLQVPNNQTLIYQLNGVERSITNSQGYNYPTISLPLSNNQVTEFKSVSLTNACGTTLANLSSYFLAIAYDIVINQDYFISSRCVGTPSEVSFSFENGLPKAGTLFTLQISKSGDASSYTDLATVTDSRTFRFTTPKLSPGNYYIRVKSSDDLYSQSRNILIGDQPSNHVMIDGKALRDTTLFKEYGSTLSASVYSSDQQNWDAWGALFSDQTRQATSSPYLTYNKIITQSEVFSVNRIWNTCGFTSPSGKVNIKVKPVVELSTYPAGTNATACAGGEIEIDYQLKGSEESAGKYLVFSLSETGKPAIKLDSVNTPSGRIRLKLPQNITQRWFSITADIKSLEVLKTITYIVYSQPNLTLFGNNTISEGEQTTLYVRANNSFAANTQIQLSDGSTHILTNTNANGITQITVKPQSTTNYTLIAPASECGTGIVSGSAAVIVEPMQTQWLTIRQVTGLAKSAICSSDTIQVYFDQYGSSGQATGFNILLSDDTGKNFTPLTTLGNYSPIRAVIPKGTPQSDYYRLRLTSTSGSVTGSTFANPLRIGVTAEGEVLTPTFLYRPGETIAIVTAFKGSLPVSYRFGDSNFSFYRTAINPTDTIRLTPSIPQTVYRIMSVSNPCGAGLINTNSSVTIELLTANEPTFNADVIQIGPNPTSDFVTIKFRNAENRTLKLFDTHGRNYLTKQSRSDQFTLDVSRINAGTYLLNIEKQKKIITYKIIKY